MTESASELLERLSVEQARASTEPRLYPPYDTMCCDGIEDLARYLRAIGYDLDTEHTRMTPYRLTWYLRTLLGNAQHPKEVHVTSFSNTDPKIDHMVVVPHIPFWSACSHHLLPFTGEVSVGYVPNNRLVGLSKIPLIVRDIARGFWMQEHLADRIARTFEEELRPLGVAVRIEAQHTCQLLDLEQPPIPKMITTVLRGVYLLNPAAKAEFLSELS